MKRSLVVLGGSTWTSLLEPLAPGAHIAVLAEDVSLDGFRGRCVGLELRDTLLVLSVGVDSRFILLFRKPLAENTVAEQVLKTGTGGVNIGACRVSTSENLNGGAYSIGGRAKPMTGDDRTGSSLGMFQPGQAASGEYTQPSGRWPPNVLLVHGPGCKRVGTKRIRGQNPAYTGSGVGSMGYYGGGSGRPTGTSIGHADSDGLETIAAWECQENCPVRLLDAQTGVLTSGSVAEHHMRNASTQPSNGGFNGKFGDMPLMGYGDSGGASRFFPQFKDDYELVAWVRRLITP